MNFKKFLIEKKRNINMVVVDIQPEYSSSIHFLPEFIDFLNENDFAKVLYLYNGEDLGMSSESDLISWLLDNGLDEDKIDDFDFFEKNYAFFRDLMDQGMGEDDIVEIGQFVMKKRKHDWRDLNGEEWEELDSIVSDISDDSNRGENMMFYLPEVVDEIKPLRLPLLAGGGRNECLREVELVFQMLNKRYRLHRKFVY